MIAAEILKSIAAQLMKSTSVSVDGKSVTVRTTSREHLKTAAFTVGGHEFQAVEQNQEKPGPMRAAGAGRPDLVVRIGRGPQLPYSLRRPVADVIV